MTKKQYRLNKWGTRLLKNNRPLFDWTNESDEIVDLLNQLNYENEQLKIRFNEEREKSLKFCRNIDALTIENEQLKKALLFFLDVANSQCSSSFGKDMEHDCQKLFNCSYDEAKKKYGGYNATWWELGE